MMINIYDIRFLYCTYANDKTVHLRIDQSQKTLCLKRDGGALVESYDYPHRDGAVTCSECELIRDRIRDNLISGAYSKWKLWHGVNHPDIAIYEDADE